MKKLCLLIFALLPVLVFAQTDTIRLSYQGTSLAPSETIYARITVSLDDGGFEKFHIRLNGTRTGNFVLPAKAASFKVEYYTLSKDDAAAAQRLLVYDKSGKPVRGAYLDAMFDEHPDSVLDLELKNYPDNYLAYARFMNVAAMIKDQQTSAPQITKLLEQLRNAKPNATELPGYLAAFCVGLAKTGKLPEAKTYLYRLFDEFPAGEQTAFAFSIYNYEYYKSSRNNVEDDVKARIKTIFLQYPTAPLAADGNVTQFLMNDLSIPLAAFEKALLPLYANGSISYYQLSSLPEICIARNEQLDTAERLLKQSIALFQSGGINYQYRLDNGHYQLYVPVLFLDLAKLCLLQHRDQDAIAYASAGAQIIAGGNTEGNFLPLLLNARADAYLHLGNLNLAMADYQRLYLSGDSTAINHLRALFPLCNVKQKTFEGFIAALKSPAHKASDLLPDITATDLNGKAVKLSSLRGKIVVLNEWGIGCGPCVAEMPELNKLVARYHNQPDVVFIGITGDKAASIVKFLKLHPYHYQVWNNAGNLTEKLNTNSLPVHMVIGRQGEVISRSIGARADIADFLRRQIDNHL